MTTKSTEFRCKKCNGEMKKSKAMLNTYTGIPDFPGDDYVSTLSPGGPGKLADCMKCIECGWSVSPSKEMLLQVELDEVKNCLLKLLILYEFETEEVVTGDRVALIFDLGADNILAEARAIIEKYREEK